MTEEEKDAYIKKLVQSNIDQQNKIAALSKKVYDLQKENAKVEELENRIRFMGKQIDNLKAIARFDQLTKAKEIIKELLDFDFLPDIEIKKQAEQFLKDQEE